MSEKKNKVVARGGALIVAIVILLLTGAGIALYFHFRQAAQPSAGAQPGPSADAPAVRPNDPLAVTIFYPAAGTLVAAAQGIPRQPDLQLQAREALAALLADPRSPQTAVFRDLRLRAFFLDSGGTVVVDLSSNQPFQKEIHASAWDELLAIYAIVNTLTRNFEEIRQVRFLFDGRESQSLAGHIDLTKTFTARADLVKP